MNSLDKHKQLAKSLEFKLNICQLLNQPMCQNKYEQYTKHKQLAKSFAYNYPKT
jgi:hypothetical protein